MRRIYAQINALQSECRVGNGYPLCLRTAPDHLAQGFIEIALRHIPQSLNLIANLAAID